jgi:hypothetical protein
MVDFADGGIDGVDMIEVKAQEEAMLPGRAATHGLA